MKFLKRVGVAVSMMVSLVAQAQVHEYHLDNGMKVLVKEDHRAPVVVSQVWYKVGSSYEHNGVTGISHMLEHMMFKGTHTHKPGDFNRIIAENGGSDNAFTGRDYTAYFQTLEASRLNVSMALESDRMRNVIIVDEEFQPERQVVREERRQRTDDNPGSRLYEQFSATAFSSSPYHHPIIGWAEDINHYTVDDLKDWYRAWYTPNNATLVVVGDVEPDRVFELAKQYYGSIESGPVRDLKPQREFTQNGERRIQLHDDKAVNPYLLMGFKVPSLATVAPEQEWEVYALEVLSGVLSGGQSARLPKSLVRSDKVASSASAGYSLYDRMNTLFLLDASPSQGVTLNQLETQIWTQLDRLKQTPVAESELEKIKAQVKSSSIFEKDSIFYQAMQLGRLETVGVGWQKADEYIEKVNAVTPEQIQAVAQKYFNKRTLTVGELLPEEAH